MSSVPSEPSPSLAARLELPSSPPLGSLGDLTPPIDGTHPTSSAEDGYIPLGDPPEMDGDDGESQSGAESEYAEEVTSTPVIVRDSREMQEDELAWRELRQGAEHTNGQLRRRSARNAEFNVDLEGEIPEEDPVGNGVNDATKDLEEVVAIWNERQRTIDSGMTRESVASVQSSFTISSMMSESAPAVIVPVLSSPIVLSNDKPNEEVVNNEAKYTESPESIEAPQLPILNKPTSSRNIPPPLHLRPPSGNTGVRVQILEASPSGSPEQATASLFDVDGLSGEGRSSFDSLLPTSPSGELLEVGDHSSTTSTSSSGDDEFRSQVRLSQRLDNLERVSTCLRQANLSTHNLPTCCRSAYCGSVPEATSRRARIPVHARPSNKPS